jgi:hypothetical protein
MGVISEEAYLEYLAAHTGIGIETLEDVSPADCLLPRTAIHLCARHSILPIRQHGELVYVSAPHGYSARRIARLVTQYPSLRSRIRLAPVARFNAYLEYHSGDVLAGVAAESLAVRFPHLSAAPLQLAKPALSPVAIPLRLAGPAALMTLAPMLVMDICGVLLAIWFLLFTSLRLAGCFSAIKRGPGCSACTTASFRSTRWSQLSTARLPPSRR